MTLHLLGWHARAAFIHPEVRIGMGAWRWSAWCDVLCLEDLMGGLGGVGARSCERHVWGFF